MSAAKITPAPPFVVRLAKIAAAVRLSINTILARARDKEDPLPLRMRRGVPRIRIDYLREWYARRYAAGVDADGQPLERYAGWRVICAALGGVDRETALAWARRSKDRLPVQGLDSRRPWIYASALRDWVHRGDLPFQAHVPKPRRARKAVAEAA